MKYFTLLVLLFVISLSSCTQGAYTQRSYGINGLTGLHTVEKTQRYYNHESAKKRNNITFIDRINPFN